MKRIISIVTFLAICTCVMGQTLPPNNIFDNPDLKISGSKGEDEYRIRIDMKGFQPREYSLVKFKEPAFVNGFKAVFEDPVVKAKYPNEELKIETEAKKIFAIYDGVLEAIANFNAAPLAGELTLDGTINLERELDKDLKISHRKGAKKIIDNLDKPYNPGITYRKSGLKKWYSWDDKLEYELPRGKMKKALRLEMKKEHQDSLERRFDLVYEKYLDYQKNKDNTKDLIIKNFIGRSKRIQDLLGQILSSNTEIRRLEEELNPDRRQPDDMKSRELTLEDKKRQALSVEKDILLSRGALTESVIRLKDPPTRNEQVRQIRKSLTLLNYSIGGVSDAYDVVLAGVIGRVQKLGELTVDSVYGPRTKDVIEAQLSEFRTQKERERQVLATEIKEIEEILRVQKEYFGLKTFNDESQREYDELERSVDIEAIDGDSLSSDSLRRFQGLILAYESNLEQFQRQRKDLIDMISKYPRYNYEIERAQLEFKNGFIENITTIGDLHLRNKKGDEKLEEVLEVLDYKTERKFTNLYPFGFSRKRDYKNLKSLNRNYRLLSYYIGANGNKNIDSRFLLPMSSLVVNYLQEHKVGRRDFSPRDEVINFEFDHDSDNNVVSEKNYKSKKLYKLERKKLFQAKVFSDLLGFSQNRENGLIQTEFTQRLNIVTWRDAFVLFPRKTDDVWNWGALAYVRPDLTFSKVEDNNRRLDINYRNDFTNGVYTPDRFVTTLDLRSHENFSTGLDLNLALLDIPSLKSTFYVDAGFRYGRVALRDSVQIANGLEVEFADQPAREIEVNTLRLMLSKATWNLQTDERFEFDFNWSWHELFLRDNQLVQVGDRDAFRLENGFVNEKLDKRYYRIELNAQLNTGPNNDGKLFFRYRYFWQRRFWNTGFAQAQVGYSFFLTSSLKAQKND